MQSILISIRPHHLKKIIEPPKLKTIELRRVSISLKPDDYVWIWECGKGLRCRLTCQYLIETTPDQMWKYHNTGLGLTQEEFEEYYTAAKKAIGIQFKPECQHYQIFPHIPLTTMQQIIPYFQPPQLHRYLTLDQSQTLEHKAKIM